MILVTGGTGFIGKALIRHLSEAGYPVRTLIRPSKKSPDLPRNIPIEVAVSSLNDERSLRAAMVGVDTIFHLAGAEWSGVRADLLQTDVQGTQNVAQAAVEVGVKRIFYISHLDADRASAYPVLKAKAIAEEYIRRCGVDYTILRSAIVFGPGDGFTTGLAKLINIFPFLFLVPGTGQTQLQPLWIEDLVTCLAWSLDNDDTRNQTYEIGGPEYLNFNDILGTIMQTLNQRRQLVPIAPPYLRTITVFLDQWFPGLPVSVYWLDYLAANRTCALDTLPRVFNLLPSRFSQRLEYLQGQKWRPSLRKMIQKPS